VSRHTREISVLMAILLLGGSLALAAPGISEIPGMSDRIAVTHAGRVAAQARILSLALGTEHAA
jgi:hypothetical protein